MRPTSTQHEAKIDPKCPPGASWAHWQPQGGAQAPLRPPLSGSWGGSWRLLGPSWRLLGLSWASRGVPGGSRGGSGRSFWRHFCRKAGRHEKSHKFIIFFFIFGIVSWLFFVSISSSSWRRRRESAPKENRFSLGGCCIFRMSGVCARNQKEKEL